MSEKVILHDLYLGLGTNLGDKEENLREAINQIEKRIGNVVALSAFYVTKPVGFDSQNDFLNAVCKVITSLPPLSILEITQIIEKEMGRKSKSVNKIYSDRIIDIDLLLFDHIILTEPKLTLPHPQLHLRDFVLSPLAEIAADYLHPVLKKTIKELKEERDCLI